MASLQQPSISVQSKLNLPSPHHPRALPSLNFSFSATFPSLKLSATRSLQGGTKMSATAASSYATALADVAKSNNTLDATSSDVEKVEKVFSDPQVLDFFANPTIDVLKKRQVLDDIVKSYELRPHTANFLNILVDAKRIDLIKEIVKEFEMVYNKLTDTELAVVNSVVRLEAEHLDKIAMQVKKLTGAQFVKVKNVIDPSLVAGFTIRYGNSGSKLIDMSVKKQLEEIAAQLDLGDIQLAV
ncbi:hypothetical protein PTKIN_Ptkin14bG0214500 [Pterospermum kingtungense]